MSPQPHVALLRRPLVVWLAVLIAVLGALAPTLSHALVLARGHAAPMMEVCTSSGPNTVALLQAPDVAVDSPDGQESAVVLVHCPFCLLSPDRVAPAPDSLVHLFDTSGDHQTPTVRQAFFFFTHFTLRPPPRGPPTISKAIQFIAS